MTLLPTVRRQMEQAAERQAGGRSQPARARLSRPTASPSNHRVRAPADVESAPGASRTPARPRRRSSAGRSSRRAAAGAGLWVGVGVAVLVALVAIIALRGHTRPVANSPARNVVRGEIVDRDGRVLARSVRMTYLVLVSDALPPPSPARTIELRRLAHLLGARRISQIKVPRNRASSILAAGPSLPLSKQGSTKHTRVASGMAYISAHLHQFPGVQIIHADPPLYPQQGLAAQLPGAVIPTSSHDGIYEGYTGRSGLERFYNSVLSRGDTLKLSLDATLERVGTQALRHAIDANRIATGGAFVAMNPDDGQIYAMGSLPTFNANALTGPGGENIQRSLNNAARGYPVINRAIQSGGATGSTFKPITAIAALESSAWSLDETYDDTGQFCFSGQCRHNAGGAIDGSLNLVNAIRLSSDDFFYNLGVLTNADPTSHPNGGALEQWASQFGIGQPTGVDIGGELPGTLPTPAWRTQRNQEEAACDKARHLPPGGCGLADGTNRPWSVGDNENLAVGQGDLQVTPLQLAVAYSAIANSGTIVRPHLGADIESNTGSVLRTIDPRPVRHLNINPAYLGAVRGGLHEAAQSPGGTSHDVFGSFPSQVYGEVGAAQYISKGSEQNYAWYAGFVPASVTSKPIVVVVWVQQGGFGDRSAAPVARRIFSQWLTDKPGPWIAGRSRSL